jgi:hypothetical protein
MNPPPMPARTPQDAPLGHGRPFRRFAADDRAAVRCTLDPR